jgi:cupin fold WbuC family metalloprotein
MRALRNELKLVKQGVFYLTSTGPTDLNELASYLESYCRENRLSMARACFHRNTESPLMAMLIVSIDFYIYPPHRHCDKFESYHIVKGRCRFREYEEGGGVTSIAILEEGQLLLNESSAFHTLEPLSDVLAFVEHTTGPFGFHNNEYLFREPL